MMDLAEYIRSRSRKVEPGLADEALAKLEAELCVRLPEEVRRLIAQVGGYEPLCEVRWQMDEEDVTFALGPSDWCPVYREAFPAYLQLLQNGCGDAWILDIDPGTGECGCVVLASHDPASLRFHFRDLEDFVVKTLDADFDLPAHDDATFRNLPPEGLPVTEARHSSDAAIREYAGMLPDSYHIFDMRSGALPYGFCWGMHGPGKRLRFGRELLFATEPEPPSALLRWLRKIFGKGR